MTKTKTTSKSKTHSAVLPERMETPAVAEATAQLGKAFEAVRLAETIAREARAADEAADAVDKEAERAAVSAGKPSPQPTRPQRKAEAEAARRRVDVARELAREALARWQAVVTENREELNAVQKPCVGELAKAIGKTLDTLGEQLDAYAVEVGAWRGLFKVSTRPIRTQADDRTRMRGMEPPPSLPDFGPVRGLGATQLREVRDSVADGLKQPTPPQDGRAEARKARAERMAKRMQEREEQEQRQANRRERASRGDVAA